MAFYPDFSNWEITEEEKNSLMEYLSSQNSETLEQVAQSATPEIKQIISQNVRGLLGMLPSSEFNIQVVTNKENLANLLASAMMTGYFLRQMEQRRDLEENLLQTDSFNKPSQD